MRSCHRNILMLTTKTHAFENRHIIRQWKENAYTYNQKISVETHILDAREGAVTNGCFLVELKIDGFAILLKESSLNNVELASKFLISIVSETNVPNSTTMRKLLTLYYFITILQNDYRKSTTKDKLTRKMCNSRFCKKPR